MTELFLIKTVGTESLNREKARARELIAEVVPNEYVYEVGSTAIDGLIGKQDLDFLVRVPAARFADVRASLDGRFERNGAQLSSDVYQGYLVDSELDVAIQLTVAGGPHDTFLDFLDRLRANPVLRDQYNALKQQFDDHGMNAYRDAKRNFIERVLAGMDDS